MPCALCNDLNFRSSREYRTWFDTTIVELNEASRQCDVCRLLQEGIQFFQGYWDVLTKVRLLSFKGRSVDGDLGLFCEIYVNGKPNLHLEFFQTAGRFNANIFFVTS
jgi:hypothetical protein